MGMLNKKSVDRLVNAWWDSHKVLLFVSLLEKLCCCCKHISHMACSSHHGAYICDFNLVAHDILQRWQLLLLYPVDAVHWAGSNGILQAMSKLLPNILAANMSLATAATQLDFCLGQDTLSSRVHRGFMAINHRRLDDQLSNTYTVCCKLASRQH